MKIKFKMKHYYNYNNESEGKMNMIRLHLNMYEIKNIKNVVKHRHVQNTINTRKRRIKPSSFQIMSLIEKV